MLKISRLERELFTQRHESGFIHFDKITFKEIENEISEQEKKIRLLINFNENLRLEIDPNNKVNLKREQLIKKMKIKDKTIRVKIKGLLYYKSRKNIAGC